MGMFDNVRVDAAVIPPWTSAMSRSAYTAEVAELTSESGGQVKDLFLTLDSYEISSNGVLIRTSNSWGDLAHRLTSEDIQQLESALPVEGRPGCWHVATFSGVLCPGDRMEFTIESGRLVSASIRAPDPVWPISNSQRKLRRADSLVKRFGLKTRRGRKWERVARRIRDRMKPFFVIDEASHSMPPEMALAMVNMVRTMRHNGHRHFVATQSSLKQS